MSLSEPINMKLEEAETKPKPIQITEREKIDDLFSGMSLTDVKDEKEKSQMSPTSNPALAALLAPSPPLDPFPVASPVDVQRQAFSHHFSNNNDTNQFQNMNYTNFIQQKVPQQQTHNNGITNYNNIAVQQNHHQGNIYMNPYQQHPQQMNYMMQNQMMMMMMNGKYLRICIS